MKTVILVSLTLFALSSYSARTVKCDDSKSTEIYMKPSFASIINFPVKPEQVIVGGKSQVSIEYIKNDLAITPLSSVSSTNIFVYLLGRRCGFTLKIFPQKFDSLVLVKDPEESKMKVKVE